MSPKHSNTDDGWIKRRFLKIEKQMREDRAAKRLQAATIGKGGITVKDGGAFISRYPESVGGGEATRFGPITPTAETGPGYALQVFDETGDDVFTVARLIPSGDTPGGSSRMIAFADLTLIGTPVATGGGAVLITSAFASINHDTVLVLAGGVGGVQVTHSTTAAAANCFIDPSDSRIWRSTSSRRNKVDIEDAEVDPAVVLQMRGRTFRDKGEVERNGETAQTHAGFIAEELHDLGLSQFVTYDTEGEPEAIAYDRLTVALLAVLKDQDARLTALESGDPHG